MCINKEIRLKTALTICHMYKVINGYIEDYLENKKLIDLFWMHYEKETVP